MNTRSPSTRVVRRWPGWGGTVGAVTFYCLSFTPSLIPRAWWLQALAAGVTALVGYTVGAIVQWVVEVCGARPSARVTRVSWIVLGVLAPIAVVAVTARSVAWQDDLRRLMGMDPHIRWWQWTLVPIVALLLCVVFVTIGRAIRLGTRTASRALAYVIPPRIALTGSVVLAVVLIVGLVQGYLLPGILGFAEASASLADSGTSAGIVQPSLPTLSGSPASLEPWDSLGSKGRDFIGQAPSRSQIVAFSNSPAMNPVRVYVGLKSAPTLAARAQLAVAELVRTGAFQRKVLVVFATTGSGWVNENLAKPLEYMYGGDSALVALQYSYLPSWISFLTGGEAADAGQALFDAVYAHWATLPEAARPRLFVSGESLGSFATEEAFGGKLPAMAANSNGGLLIGPTQSNPMWRSVTNGRDAGSPVWRPVYQDGSTVRFAQAASDLASPNGPWDSARVAYLENGSDPVTWWTEDLIWERPQWLDNPRAPDVSGDMSWYPFVTFWQVTCDLAAADSVPDGHGHRFGTTPAAAWAAVAQPPGWNASDTARLEHLLAQEALAH